jgi:hypothetical protein
MNHLIKNPYSVKIPSANSESRDQLIRRLEIEFRPLNIRRLARKAQRAQDLVMATTAAWQERKGPPRWRKIIRSVSHVLTRHTAARIAVEVIRRSFE